MNNELDKEFKKIFDKVMEPAILIVEEVGNIINKRKQEIISKFLRDWEGLKYLCRDDDDAWEYWIKIYKKWEKEGE